MPDPTLFEHVASAVVVGDGCWGVASRSAFGVDRGEVVATPPRTGSVVSALRYDLIVVNEKLTRLWR